VNAPGPEAHSPAPSRRRDPAGRSVPAGRRVPASVSWALKILVAAACAYFVVRKVPWREVGPALGQCRYGYIALSVALQYAVAACNAFRWKILARNPGLPLRKYLHFVLLGQFFNLFLPTYVAAEAVKVIAFGRKYGGTQENIGIALLSKTAGMLIQMLMGAVGLALYAKELRERGVFAKAHLDGRTLVLALAALALAGAGVWWFRHSLKAQTWFRTILSISKDRKLVAQALFWTALIQFLAAASSYCLFLSLWPETHFWQVVLFTTLILAALSLPFGFGGVGVREYLNLLLFTDVGGIPAHITFAVNIVGYIPVFTVALTGGAWMLFRKLRR
jgi:uncharacterized membrane protein YbhN (UPF0104 family)